MPRNIIERIIIEPEKVVESDRAEQNVRAAAALSRHSLLNDNVEIFLSSLGTAELTMLAEPLVRRIVDSVPEE